VRRRRTLTAAAGLLLVPVSASSAAAHSGPVTAPPSAAASAPAVAPGFSDRVLALTNRERTLRGLRPLAFSACADGFADSWAGSLARTGALSHQPLRPVLTACRARQVAENVAVGAVTPEQLVAMWMASPGHRANLLQARSTHLGVGVGSTAGRTYGVQVFLTR
jgi:uncharacterized protein YkwD